jgi:hypothetical protein
VRVAGAGHAPYVVGQDGDCAHAEVNVNYPGQPQPSDIFPEHKLDAFTGRRRAVSTGQTQTIKRVVGILASKTVGVSVSSLWIRCRLRIVVFPSGVGSGGAIALTICRMSTTPAILPSSLMTPRLSSPD